MGIPQVWLLFSFVVVTGTKRAISNPQRWMCSVAPIIVQSITANWSKRYPNPIRFDVSTVYIIKDLPWFWCMQWGSLVTRSFCRESRICRGFDVCSVHSMILECSTKFKTLPAWVYLVTICARWWYAMRDSIAHFICIWKVMADMHVFRRLFFDRTWDARTLV